MLFSQQAVELRYMEAPDWFIIFISLFLSVLFIKILLPLLFPSHKNKTLPGPLTIPIISSILWLLKISSSGLDQVLRDLKTKHGPIFLLPVWFRPTIFVADGSLAHEALVQNGAVFSDRPEHPLINKIINSNQHNINSAAYGPLWRTLRRNLTSEMLNPSRVKSFSGARKRVLGILLEKLKSDSESSSSGIRVIHHFQYAMFCLLVFMCFGDIADEKKIREIEDYQCRLIVNIRRFSILNFWPRITKILFHERWKEFLQILKDREATLIPLIAERRKAKQERSSKDKEESTVPYIDTLLDLQIPEENTRRNLHEPELISLCSEFLTAGTDTTSTALQWIMANLLKYPAIQDRVFREIRAAIVDRGEREVKEEDVQKLPYLKAVILEGLRLHPPGNLVLPHVVTDDVVLQGSYSVPKKSIINFMVAEMGRDPRVWEDPMAFKPERFLNSEQSELEAFDVTGSKEINMMPFGAGRRICPGYNLALMHLEYFVANLIWNFEWKVENEGDVDLSEKQEFTVVMKTPLQAQIIPRFAD